MMLNSLVGAGVPAPTEAALSPYQYHTEGTVLTSECVRRVPTHLGAGQPLDARFVALNGVTLPEWVRRRRSARAGPSLADAPASVFPPRQAGMLSCFAKYVTAAPRAQAGTRADAARGAA